MRQIRLKHNIITDSGMLMRDSVVDEDKVPEHLRTEELITYDDLEGRQGRVLLLHGITYTNEPQRYGSQRMSFPVTLSMGELVRLSDIPERQRADLISGKDYLEDWTEKDRLKLRHQETQRDLQSFEANKIEFYDV
jgi:hypothetical protein